ncbi:MAG: alpha/beta fold hydrolase [Acidimicrobiales bacterium]
MASQNPLSPFLRQLDPLSFAKSLAETTTSAARKPRAVVDLAATTASGWVRTGMSAANLLVTGDTEPPRQPERGDRRFSDEAWEKNPGYFALLQLYLLGEELMNKVVDAADFDDKPSERKARFAAQLLVDALSPTNTLLGNPAALRKAKETNGASLAKGFATFLRDLVQNQGWPRKVDASEFTVGVDMAATPGKVVFRNDLIELIEYAPQTEEVYEIPLLLSPPWINKFYIMDLAPGKSLAEWAIQHGHRTFAISYRNPDASMRDMSFADYMHQGTRAAIDAIRSITGAKKVNTASVCLGGTLTAMALAYEAGRRNRSINCASQIVSLLDFEEPGVLGAFTDDGTVEMLEETMRDKGYLEAKDMARTFDLLRANDLVFNYVVNNWLMGEEPPAFDLLAWNDDSTRMPAKMHSEYLRQCYMNNDLSNARMVVDGRTLDLSKVKNDVYVLATVGDHIVPWTSAYVATQRFGGKNRFVLSTSGHIAGIVNPPSPKAKHWVNEDLPADPDKWLDGAELVESTWWEDWAVWIGERAGDMIPAPTELGTEEFPALCDAPGTYVLAKS